MHSEVVPEDTGMELEVTVEVLHDVLPKSTETRTSPSESPRKPPQKRHAERFDIGTPDRPQTKAREGLDDRPTQSSEQRTQDDVIGPRAPAEKRQTEAPKAPEAQRARVQDQPTSPAGGGNSGSAASGSAADPPAISNGSSSSSDVSPNNNDNSGDISKVSKAKKASITEIFSPSRVCARCEQHGLVPGSSFDLHTGHDLSRYSVQREVEKAIDEEDPDLLIGSPLAPSSRFSRTW